MPYNSVVLKEGVSIQYLAVHAVRWQPEWGQPQIGFIEMSEEELRKSLLAQFPGLTQLAEDHMETLEAEIEDLRKNPTKDSKNMIARRQQLMASWREIIGYED